MSKFFIRVINTTDPNRYNCVKYVRARVPNLPFGQWTIWDKKKIINSHKAKIGRVAIMKVGLPWGHVGIVIGKEDDRIVIKESNFYCGKVTERQGTEKELKIIGYFNPKL